MPSRMPAASCPPAPTCAKAVRALQGYKGVTGTITFNGKGDPGEGQVLHHPGHLRRTPPSGLPTGSTRPWTSLLPSSRPAPFGNPARIPAGQATDRTLGRLSSWDSHVTPPPLIPLGGTFPETPMRKYMGSVDLRQIVSAYRSDGHLRRRRRAPSVPSIMILLALVMPGLRRRRTPSRPPKASASSPTPSATCRRCSSTA